MKSTILEILNDIQDLPYLTGQKFEWACLHAFVDHFGATPYFPSDTERALYEATKGATFYGADELVIIFQPHGSQASPDIEVWFKLRCLLKIECKANENASQPNWNQHVPSEDVLYLWNSKKRGTVYIRAGFQILSTEDSEAVRAFYKQLKTMAKSMATASGDCVLDVALRFNLSHDKRSKVFIDSHELTQIAIDWACKEF